LKSTSPGDFLIEKIVHRALFETMINNRQPFSHSTWWYAAFELLIRLLETSCLVFFNSHIDKTFFASFAALLALIVLREYEPWIDPSDNSVAKCGQLLIFFWLYALQAYDALNHLFPGWLWGTPLVLLTIAFVSFATKVGVDVTTEKKKTSMKAKAVVVLGEYRLPTVGTLGPETLERLAGSIVHLDHAMLTRLLAADHLLDVQLCVSATQTNVTTSADIHKKMRMARQPLDLMSILHLTRKLGGVLEVTETTETTAACVVVLIEFSLPTKTLSPHTLQTLANSAGDLGPDVLSKLSDLRDRAAESELTVQLIAEDPASTGLLVVGEVGLPSTSVVEPGLLRQLAHSTGELDPHLLRKLADLSHTDNYTVSVKLCVGITEITTTQRREPAAGGRCAMSCRTPPRRSLGHPAHAPDACFLRLANKLGIPNPATQTEGKWTTLETTQTCMTYALVLGQAHLSPTAEIEPEDLRQKLTDWTVDLGSTVLQQLHDLRDAVNSKELKLQLITEEPPPAPTASDGEEEASREHDTNPVCSSPGAAMEMARGLTPPRLSAWDPGSPRSTTPTRNQSASAVVPVDMEATAARPISVHGARAHLPSSPTECPH
jgi:hypothetical protein